MTPTHNHFIKRCECGSVLSQCRCPELGKAEIIVIPCEHETGDLKVGVEVAGHEVGV